ncbi:MAG: sigma-70 family RNA polymerase sigma factor [Frankia sp.]|nr:sigma-70 family RNA polymerase sigma factor [Frankia sp.]
MTVDEAARPDFATLWAANYHALCRLAAVITGDDRVAEDVVQEAFVRFALNRWRLRDPEKVLPYLRSTVCNLCRSRARRMRRTPAPVVIRDAASAEDEAVLNEDEREVLDALQRLSVRQREVILLRYWLGLSEAEMATELRISRGAVKSHAARGLAQLAALLGERR